MDGLSQLAVTSFEVSFSPVCCECELNETHRCVQFRCQPSAAPSLMTFRRLHPVPLASELPDFAPVDFLPPVWTWLHWVTPTFSQNDPSASVCVSFLVKFSSNSACCGCLSLFRTSRCWCRKGTNLARSQPPTWTRRAADRTPSSASSSLRHFTICSLELVPLGFLQKRVHADSAGLSVLNFLSYYFLIFSL